MARAADKVDREIAIEFMLVCRQWYSAAVMARILDRIATSNLVFASERYKRTLTMNNSWYRSTEINPRKCLEEIALEKSP